MKLKFPKKIQIDEIIFTVKYDPKSGGGSFNHVKNIIEIGTKYYPEQPTIVLAIIIHELKEIIHANQATRFDRPDVDSDYLFIYDHRQHTDLCYRLAGLLNNFIK